jgi:hypothetical protein
MAAAFGYPVAVSRRILVSIWMRCDSQPDRSSAITCYRFSSLDDIVRNRPMRDG